PHSRTAFPDLRRGRLRRWVGDVQHAVRLLAHWNLGDRLRGLRVNDRHVIRPSVGRIEPRAVERERDAPGPLANLDAGDYRSSPGIDDAHRGAAALGDVHALAVGRDRQPVGLRLAVAYGNRRLHPVRL